MKLSHESLEMNNFQNNWIKCPGLLCNILYFPHKQNWMTAKSCTYLTNSHPEGTFRKKSFRPNSF